ncbi:MAG TPA: bile acid:sodium symporter family protein [Gammaproteobacteria bacterium]|nr:bile acid:sodium symporter family protein [Gammaproteobacteria bacterium]
MGRLRISLFTWLILGAVVVAFVWPVQGEAAVWFGRLTTAGVALLFFVHGAALPREAVIGGLTQWRLHLFIFSITFIVFPLLVLPLAPLGRVWLPADLVLGFLYLAALPSAVSSSIAFTAIARGNVPAAVCSSAGSNVFGMMLTPVLLSFMIGSSAEGGFSLFNALQDIVFIMLLPFGVGQLIRPWVAELLDRKPVISERVDQVVLLLIVYVAFAQSVTDGLWQEVPTMVLVLAVVLCLVLLLGILAVTWWLARRLHFSRGDEIAAVFCGSKKSLASGLPMAKVMFAAHPGFGLIVLPIIIYNQVQIIVGALLAQRYAERGEARG